MISCPKGHQIDSKNAKIPYTHCWKQVSLVQKDTKWTPKKAKKPIWNLSKTMLSGSKGAMTSTRYSQESPWPFERKMILKEK